MAAILQAFLIAFSLTKTLNFSDVILNPIDNIDGLVVSARLQQLHC